MENKFKYFALNKPYGYLSQFKDENGSDGLHNILTLPQDIYPVGRLDKDSEGLLLLTNDKSLNNKLLNPKNQHKRTYIVQVEGAATNEIIYQLEEGVEINVDGKKYKTLASQVEIIVEPDYLWQRVPPIRVRKTIPTSWLRISLFEGKNRQVRKMTASVGLPTLRLIRESIENLTLGNLKIGEIKQFEQKEFLKLLKQL